jgi:hypothetical protein
VYNYRNNRPDLRCGQNLTLLTLEVVKKTLVMKSRVLETGFFFFWGGEASCYIVSQMGTIILSQISSKLVDDM